MDAPHLVFLPGMSGAGRFWCSVIAELPPPIVSVSLDWPGLGPVPALPEVSEFDHLVRLVLPHLRPRSVLVAQSMGGVVALQAALDAGPELVGLVLCATSGGLDVDALGATDWRPKYRQEWPEAPGWAFDRPVVTEGELRSIDLPTLVICGTRDPISPQSVADALVGALPRASKVVFDTDDHMFASRDHAKGVADAICSFLAALDEG